MMMMQTVITGGEILATIGQDQEAANELSNLYFTGDLNRMPVQDAKGVYELDGKVYVVVPNKSKTAVYAKVWNQGYLEYAPGIIYRLHPCHKTSLERGREISRAIGACCRCGRTLTDPNSVEAGIGPVCATYFA